MIPLTNLAGGQTFLIAGRSLNQVQEETDLFSSSKSLYVDYINSHTSVIISSKSAVKVRLSKPVVGGQTTGKHKMAIRPQKGPPSAEPGGRTEPGIKPGF